MNLISYRHIGEMQDKIVGLLSSNYEQAYLIIFKFIRKMCLQLRATINDKKKYSIKNIYNWQFVNSIQLWTKCVLEYYNRKEADVNLLAYPLVQMIIGVIRLDFVDIFFCLRLNLVRILIQISQKTNIFVPVGNYLLEILESNLFTKKYNDFKETNVDIFLLLKLKQNNLNNYNIAKSIFDETLSLLTSYFAINSNSLAFPEFVFPLMSRLKKLSKVLKNKNFKTEVKNCLERIVKHIEHVNGYREKVNYIVKDLDTSKQIEDELKKENIMLEEYEKINIREKEFIESRISQVKGEFIKI